MVLGWERVFSIQIVDCYSVCPGTGFSVNSDQLCDLVAEWVMRMSVGCMVRNMFLSLILPFMCFERDWFRFFSLTGYAVLVREVYVVGEDFVCFVYIIWGWGVQEALVYFLGEFSVVCFPVVYEGSAVGSLSEVALGVYVDDDGQVIRGK